MSIAVPAPVANPPVAQTERNRLWIELATVGGFVAFIFYYGLGAFGLLGADEPRYAQVAREMLARHDWITPYLYGHPWLEKPALYYWRAMFAFEVFGVHDWAARLPSATMATAMIVIVYFHMRRFRPGAQFDAALMTIASVAIVGFSRAAATDMQLAAPFVMGMLGWYAWQETGRRVWMFDFYFFMGIGTLAKGPVAPGLAALIIFAYAAFHRDWRMVWRTLWWPGIVLYSAIVLPWFTEVQLHNPDFLNIFFLQNNLERYTTNLYRHPHAFWYYVPIMLVAVLPWTAIVVAALADAVRHRIWRYPNPHTDDGFPLFLILWGIVPVIFFSFSVSKLPGYILPSVPPLTILAADYLRRLRARGERLGTGFIVAHAFVAGLMMAAILIAPHMLLRGQKPPASVVWVGVICGIAVLVGVLLTLRARGLDLLRFVTLVPVVLGVAFILTIAAPTVNSELTARPVARELDNMNAGSVPLAVYHVSRNIWFGLAFYRNQVIPDYTENGMPAPAHIVVAPAGSYERIEEMAGGRRVSRVGSFDPQHLEFYWVFPPGVEKQHPMTMPMGPAPAPPQGGPEHGNQHPHQ